MHVNHASLQKQELEGDLQFTHPFAFKIRNTTKQQCDYPAYLFWKLQCQLTKLNYRLNRTKRHVSPLKNRS